MQPARSRAFALQAEEDSGYDQSAESTKSKNAHIYAINHDSPEFENIHVVLPVHNKGQLLASTLRRLERLVKKNPLVVWVIDDGSTDETISAAISASQDMDVRIVKHEEQLGLGATLRSGIRSVLHSASENDVVMFLLAEVWQDPGMIDGMLEQIQDGADIVLASKFAAPAGEHRLMFLHRVLSRSATYALNAFLPFNSDLDSACMYRAYRARILQKASEFWGDNLILERDSACLVELLLKLRMCDPVIREIPILESSRSGLGGSLEFFRTFLHYLRLGVHFRSIDV